MLFTCQKTKQKMGIALTNQQAGSSAFHELIFLFMNVRYKKQEILQPIMIAPVCSAMEKHCKGLQRGTVLPCSPAKQPTEKHADPLSTTSSC